MLHVSSDKLAVGQMHGLWLCSALIWLCFALLVFLILVHELRELLRQGLTVSGQKNVQKAKPNHTTILKTCLNLVSIT